MNRSKKESLSDRDFEALRSEREKTASQLPARLMRYETAKLRALSMEKYLQAGALSDNRTNPLTEAAFRLSTCANYLIFRDYYTVDRVHLHAGRFCQLHQLCPFCAIRRGSKLVQGYLPVYEYLMGEHPGWKSYLVTLTVKNGDDLIERLDRLTNGHRRLQDRRRDVLKKGRGRTVWSAVKAAVGAFEVTNRGQGWHPHIHLVALCDGPIDQGELSLEWQGITGDSFIVDVRPFGEGQTALKSFCEVFKYALKFSELSLADNWTAYKATKGRRMIFSYGAFRGVEVSEELTDSPLEDLPFVELFYRYLPGCGYDLRSVKNSVAVAIAGAGAVVMYS